MRRQAQSAVFLDPAIGTRGAPGRLAIQPMQAGRNNALLFLLLVPDRSFGLDHHFVGTDDSNGLDGIVSPRLLQERTEQ